MSGCARCGQPFVPKPTELKTIPMTRMCEDCLVRNLFDALDMPTPPELLDRHSKIPTLSDREYRRKLNDPTPDPLTELKEKGQI